MNIIMFSGQGSQYPQMGKNLFDSESIFNHWMTEQDKLVQKFAGYSILEELYFKKINKTSKIDNIIFSHPALFMVQYSLYKLLESYSINPMYLLGVSLGEFVAAVAADCLSLTDALECIIEHAFIFKDHCPRGGMIAILDNYKVYENNGILREHSEFVGANSENHFLISFVERDIDCIKEFLFKKNILYQIMPFEYPAHSSSMDSIKEKIIEINSKYQINQPKTPIISCAKAQICTNITNDHFWTVLRGKIRFNETIVKIEDFGNYNYIDAGPSSTLVNILKSLINHGSKSKYYSILTPYNKNMGLKDSILNDYKSLHNYENIKFSTKTAGKDQAMTGIIFPGQGVQHVGMGNTLFKDYNFQTKLADSILGYSIEELCLKDNNRILTQTEYSQPAIYIVNTLMYQNYIESGGLKPKFLAGHSLGEYCALYAAGSISFEEGLTLVKKRGEIMAKAIGGTMAAIIGLQVSEIEKVLENENIDSVDIANYNGPNQFVISGPKHDIINLKDIFEKNGAELYIELKVSGPFHSRYMQSARDDFERYLKEIDFKVPRIPVISNVNAKPYPTEKIRDLLAEQITNPVQWINSINYMINHGVTDFIEIGPRKILTRLVDSIKKYHDNGTAKRKYLSELGNTVSDRHKEKQIYCSKIIPLNDTSYSAKPFLGSNEFLKEYNLKYPYVSGSMYRGIASGDLVIRMANAGMLGFFGSGGCSTYQVESAIKYIKTKLEPHVCFGMNILSNPYDIKKEMELVELYLKYNVSVVEASAYMQLNEPIVYYRLKGLSKDDNGNFVIGNRIMAKVSRPEIAELFMNPAPENYVRQILEKGKISVEQAELSKHIPMADDITVEADSGGHTDQGRFMVLIPAMLKLRDGLMKKLHYQKKIRIGAAGGIGTPESAAAAFILGADYIVTGSINQCTVESRTSENAKKLLEQMNVQDTDYAPAGDMFEYGAKVQVLKKGLFFPSRANKLYSIYQNHNSLDELDSKLKIQLQEKYFKKSFDEIYSETKEYFNKINPDMIKRAENSSKQKMALIFRWYFHYSQDAAISGNTQSVVDYQIHCGPALGAFNQWVKGTELEKYQNRHVDEIAIKIIKGAEELLIERYQSIFAENKAC